MKRYALTAVGKDQPGIVAAVTEPLYAHECNIEDSSMTILAEEFAIILIMSVPDSVEHEKLKNAIDEASEKLGLSVHLKEIGEATAVESRASDHLVTVSGYDRPGIVYKTTKMLAKWGANVTDLTTKVVAGDEGKIYIMIMEVRFPDNIVDEAVEGSLKALGDSLGVAIGIKAIESYDPL